MQRQPETLVMEGDTRFKRRYRKELYSGYKNSRKLYFDVKSRAPRTYHPKERVLGMDVNGVQKAYSFVELSKRGEGSFKALVGGKVINVHWHEMTENAYITDEAGQVMVSTIASWFAWYAFNTEVFKAQK